MPWRFPDQDERCYGFADKPGSEYRAVLSPVLLVCIPLSFNTLLINSLFTPGHVTVAYQPDGILLLGVEDRYMTAGDGYPKQMTMRY